MEPISPRPASTNEAEKENQTNGSELSHSATNSEGLPAMVLIRHLRCLLDFISSELKDTLEARRAIEGKTIRKISFEDLWYLYKPGDLVLTLHTQWKEPWRILSTGGGHPKIGDTSTKCKRPSTFAICCVAFDFDGSEFGAVYKTFYIKPYRGKREVASLIICPATLCRSVYASEIEFEKRGRNFSKLCGVSHRQYNRVISQISKRVRFPHLASGCIYLFSGPSRSIAKL